MIYKLEIENFRSIRDRQVLDLGVPLNAPVDSTRVIELWPGSRERVPRVVALFGANASGKSTILKALSITVEFIATSFSDAAHAPVRLEPFNDEESRTKPTRVKVWLSAPEPPYSDESAAKCVHCYELVVENEGDRRHVAREGIFYWPTKTGRKTRLIERCDNGDIKAAKVLEIDYYRPVLSRILRPNASMVSTLVQLNHPIAHKIASAAESIQTNMGSNGLNADEHALPRFYESRPEMLEGLNDEIQRLDFGIRKVGVVMGKSGPELEFWHREHSRSMPISRESHGTRRFVEIYPLLASAFATGSPVIIDEFELASHPILLPEIVDWFRDPERNPRNAQLWMSCHHASFLEELSKDEIAFCEKDWYGRSTLYALNDVKAVRRNDNYYKKYLGGVYGAVPRFG